MKIEEYNLKQLVSPLLEWYKSHARILPWREYSTPYRVWVSEIMLQQTRVEAVKPYFERFVKALPDVRSLAECPEEKLLKLWEGLGYYNRVRNMQTAARQSAGGIWRAPKIKRNRPLYGGGDFLHRLRKVRTGGGRKCVEGNFPWGGG